MSAEILVDKSGLTFRSRWLEGRLPAGNTVWVAHFGCRLPGCLRKKDQGQDPAVPRQSPLDRTWTEAYGGDWARTEDATGKLGRGLTQAANLAEASGVVLYDTMRKGSDYWRPGNLLTLAAQVVRDNVPHHAVSYARQDVLCPPPELLEQFRTTAMTFGEYATEYAAYLREGNPSPLSEAAGAVILAQLQGLLATFYCTDPYIPSYGDPAALQVGTPYNQRHWLDQDEPKLRNYGCHRVVLTEEVARFFSHQGVPTAVIEIDQALGRCLRRDFASLSSALVP